MKLKNVEIVTSPDFKDRVRLIGEVAYDYQPIQSELFWFEVSQEYRECLSASGNPWLICLLPLAVTLGESLDLCRPVDCLLYENIKKLMTIWKIWYPDIHVISLEADILKMEEPVCKKTAAFFSGGIDSFYTILHKENNFRFGEKVYIDELLTIWGHDIPFDNFEAFMNFKDKLSNTAHSLDKKLVDVRTNIRKTLWGKSDWGLLSHGCFLASVGLALEKRYGKILIASTFGYENLRPWGTHVITDPLLSTSKLAFIHDSPETNKIEKAEFIAKSKLAKDYLHVCWRQATDQNCSNCLKCYKTMMMLDIFGKLRDFTTFDHEKYDLKKGAKLYLENNEDRNSLGDIRKLALKRGRVDLVKAIDHSFKHSAQINKYMPFAKKFHKWLSRRRFLWRWADLFERLLLSDSII